MRSDRTRLNQAKRFLQGSAKPLFVSSVVWILVESVAAASLVPKIAPASSGLALSREQAKTFRSWFVTIVEDQVSRGPNPRWNHRDCAGLVRFAVAEAVARHDDRWRKANGFLSRVVPAEIELSNEERTALRLWKTGDSDNQASREVRSPFVRALPLIQQNADFIGKTFERAEPGDLLFFDQGDEQHVMVWTGRRIVYHNGHRPTRRELATTKSTDNGLRAVTVPELLAWSDTRWQPKVENPNFVGIYRFSFLRNHEHQGSL